MQRAACRILSSTESNCVTWVESNTPSSYGKKGPRGKQVRGLIGVKVRPTS